MLLHLQDRAGQRFAPKQIAHMFQRATVEARELLDALFEEGLVRSGVDGTTRVFYIAGPQDQPRTSDRIVGRGELKGWEAGLRRFEALCMTVRR
ncbi:hypothetical protein ACU4GD_27795 [Cupriavidus basilensis]